MPKLTYLGCQSLLLGVAVWKLNKMGLLPETILKSAKHSPFTSVNYYEGICLLSKTYSFMTGKLNENPEEAAWVLNLQIKHGDSFVAGRPRRDECRSRARPRNRVQARERFD